MKLWSSLEAPWYGIFFVGGCLFLGPSTVLHGPFPTRFLIYALCVLSFVCEDEMYMFISGLFVYWILCGFPHLKFNLCP
ncbi:hypothetical protein HanRHA438_Chr04g0181261 [Helianthus annuus]|nr:hypothetical protein HanRHA438_Chr04g0181261 [Helianthus annuus]